MDPPSGGIDLLRKWEDYCTKKAEMYEAGRVYYMVCGRSVTIPAILVAGLSSVANIGLSASGMGCPSPNWFTLGFGASGLTAAAVLAISQYLKLAELQAQSEIVSGEFEKLALDIRIGLSDRNAAELVKDVKRRMDGLMDRAPSLPKHIERRVGW